MSDETSRPRSRARRIVRRALLTIAAALTGWVALVAYPQPLFAYTARDANVVLHARRPFPAETKPLLEDVLRRISHSPIYDPGSIHHVFLCDTPALYRFLALWQYKSGGVTRIFLGRYSFIRPYDIERGTVFGRQGEVKSGGRSLAYFIAHEITHAMTADRIGAWHYRRLAPFQTEGYADYVAFDRQLDLRAERDALLRDTPEMDPKRSGLYRRYELLVDYLFERRGMSVDRLLGERLDPRAIEARLVADPGI